MSTVGSVGVDNGGLGSVIEPVAGGIIYSDGTLVACSAAGSSGQFLQSNGTAAPTWSAGGPGGGITQLTGDVTAGPGSGSVVATIPAASIDLTAQVKNVLPVANGGTGSSAFAANSIPFSNGTILTQDNANFSWNDSIGQLNVLQPSTVATENTVLLVTSDPSGSHGHGAHIEIAGNPGGGGTIFRTDGGANRSWLQIYAGGYDGSQGGQIYVNGNNSTDGDAGGVQVALGLVNANFQVLDASYNTLFGVTSTNTGTGAGTINCVVLSASEMVGTDASKNLVSIAYSAIPYSPAVPGNWAVVPTTIAQALDRIAAKIGPV